MRIGATIHEVENKFGTPSFRFGPVGDLVVLAYGRSHLFQFKNNNLVRASSEPVIFKNEFINYLEFDERFDERQWQLLDKYSKGDNVESEIIANANREGISEETQLIVHTEKYLKNN